MSVATLGHLMLKQETVFGTKVTPDVAIEIKSESITEDDTLLTPQYINGKREKSRAIQGRYTAGGSFDFDMTPEGGFGWLLKGLFGQVSTANPDTGVYDHTFTPLQSSTFPSYTVEVDLEAMTTDWIGCTFSGLSLSVTPDGLLESSLTLLAQRSEIVSPQTPTFTTVEPFTPFNAVFTLNGSTDLDFETMDLAFENNVESVPTLDGNRWDGRHTVKNLGLTGSLKQELGSADATEKYYGASGATSPLETVDYGSLVMTMTHGTVITGAYYYTLTVTIPRILYRTVAKNLSGPEDRIVETISWEAILDAIGSPLVTAVLRNGVSTYA